MTIEVVTGLNGAGKTLYSVSTKLQARLKERLPYLGNQITRRLCISGIPDLLLDHVVISPAIEHDGEFEGPQFERLRGSPPILWTLNDQPFYPVEGEPIPEGAVQVEHDVRNWWMWCMPGDVIVVDEAQRVFRPMASGAKVPKFIAKLETHRHYGVDFLLMTQHANLLHSNVRQLGGPHEDVRRVWGGARTMIYQWGRTADAGKMALATSKWWAHDRKAFGLYKSSELHTKTRVRLPLAVFVLGIALVALPALAWNAFSRVQSGFEAKPAARPVSAASAPAARSTQAASAPVWRADAASSVSVPASAPVAWAGCIHMAKRCECIDSSGVSREVEWNFCVANASRSGMGVRYALTTTGAVASSRPAELGIAQSQDMKVQAAGFNAGDYRDRRSR